MGVGGRDRTTSTVIRNSRRLSHPELEMLYNVGLPRRFVDAIPDTILKRQPTITLGTDKDQKVLATVQKFERYRKQIKFGRAYAEVMRLQRIYGGAVLVMLLDDGQEADQPVNLNRLRGIRGLVPLSRWDIFPEDYSIMDYSNPEFYRITTQQRITEEQKDPTLNVKIHSSRVARFDGLFLPWRQRQTNNGWGLPPLQVVWEAWKKYESMIAGLDSLISESSIFWHKMPGLFAKILAGGEADLMKRMEVNQMSRSIYKGMLLDKDEEMGFSERNLANLATASAPFAEYLQATTGWPASILMGSSPGGLGKEGRFEERVWAELVDQWQTVYCVEPIEQIFELMFMSKEGPTGGKPPENWDVHFPSTFTETPKEKAELRSLMANVDSTEINSGILDPLEVRKNRHGSAEYSIETVLDDTITAQKEMKSESTFQAEMIGIQSQANQLQGLDPQGNPLPDPNAVPGAPEDTASGGGAAPDESQAAQGETAPGGSAPQAPEPTPPEPSKPKATTKKDSAPEGETDRYDACEIEIQVLTRKSAYTLGVETRADGQPIPVILGPNRLKAYAIYKADMRDTPEDEVEDLYLTGFASLRAARTGLEAFFPGHRLAPMTTVSRIPGGAA